MIISALAVAGRRTLLRWSAALGLVIALGAPGGALGSADVATIHFADRGVFHVTVLAHGTVAAALGGFALVCG